jgi:hypothetical protein
MTELELFRHALKAWRDPDVTSVILHKPGSHLRLPDGEEVIVGSPEPVPEYAGIC